MNVRDIPILLSVSLFVTSHVRRCEVTKDEKDIIGSWKGKREDK
jgi:hypothetical protein